MRTSRKLLLGVSAALVCCSLASTASGRSSSELEQDVAAISARIQALNARVGDVSERVASLERDLSLHRQRLTRLVELYGAETKRLHFFRSQSRLARARLSRRLVETYKSEGITVGDVLLSASSFTDVLEQAAYSAQIARQDARIADDVADAGVRVQRARERTRRVRVRVAAETRVIAVRTEQQRMLRQGLLSERVQLAGRLGLTRSELAAARTREAQAIAAADATVRAQLSVAVPAVPTATGSSGFIWPVGGSVTSGFGPRGGRLHAGIDIVTPAGTPIHAAAAGTVAFAGWEGGYGNYTCIGHGAALSTCYAHQSSIAVSAGQPVSQGQVIGYVGNTGHSFGAHLHFEVRVNGGPVDPLGYL